MGAGGIVQHNVIVHGAVNDPSVLARLPPQCQQEVAAINAKGLAGWNVQDYAYMVSMLHLAHNL